MSAYYNEFDPDAAAWLRELIKRNLIAPGDVDERSIKEVRPDDLKGYDQYHFFAGIGGWSYALRLAGWPDVRPVWTGSCPCQPFSVAGKGEGAKDPRHLWPDFASLIGECRPPVVFGEQVASAVGHGWFDGVSADLESQGFTVGAAVLGAHSVGAPHIRQRLYWVADAYGAGQRAGGGAVRDERNDPRRGREAGGVGDTDRPGPQGRDFGGDCPGERTLGAAGLGFWAAYDLLPCADGKARRVEPGTFPLAHGVPARVVRLRGYGNAIVPQVAAAFITAYLETVK